VFVHVITFEIAAVIAPFRITLAATDEERGL
jgi:hypothetical protein